MKQGGLFTGIAIAALAFALAGGLVACAQDKDPASGSGTGTDSGPITIHEGTPLMFFLDDAGVAKLRADMEAGRTPAEVNVLYDASGTRPELIIDDPEQIQEIYRLFSQMLVPEEGKAFSVTDSYHHVIFTLEDGTTVSFSFEGDRAFCYGQDLIPVSDLGGLWPYVQQLQDEKMGIATGEPHSISIASGEDLIWEYPSTAAAGETVIIETAMVADGEVVLSVDGAAGDWTSGNTYEFLMPDNDVVISASVSTAGYAGS